LLREIFIWQNQRQDIRGGNLPAIDAILTSSVDAYGLVKFYKADQPQAGARQNGRLKLNAGQPQYEEVKVQRLDYAVDQFSSKQAARASWPNIWLLLWCFAVDRVSERLRPDPAIRARTAHLHAQTLLYAAIPGGTSRGRGLLHGLGTHRWWMFSYAAG
jgi:hypothetical protein